MLRKQGLSPEQISNVYAGTQDKETTQLMRKPSTVGPAVGPTVASRAKAAADAKTNYEGSEPLKQFGVPHDAPWNAYETQFDGQIASNTDIDADMLFEIQQQFSLASQADDKFLNDGGKDKSVWAKWKRAHFKKFAAADTREKQAQWMTEYKARKARDDSERATQPRLPNSGTGGGMPAPIY